MLRIFVRRLGIGLIVFGLLLQMIAVWDFTSPTEVTGVLGWIGDFGFMYWLLFVVVGVILAVLARPKRTQRS